LRGNALNQFGRNRLRDRVETAFREQQQQGTGSQRDCDSEQPFAVRIELFRAVFRLIRKPDKIQKGKRLVMVCSAALSRKEWTGPGDAMQQDIFDQRKLRDNRACREHLRYTAAKSALVAKMGNILSVKHDGS